MEAPASERLPTAPFRYTPRPVPRPAVLRFVGALDAFTVPGERARLDAVAEARPREIMIDFSRLEVLDSAGVHALVTLHKRVTAQGGKVVIVHAHDQPLAVLELLKLKAFFAV
jgi:anti-sigma B factor antagonist